ncbi:hypothetical protein Dthio_PD0044 [Desulfonatronospira thiodismutans ASO3-1]|uniref:ParB/Spo0J HTH domain-containing protein n=1 Tax=Desulfonatronospira thiodismutans ASO3-1 TaxID=555779 RepID=D6SUZ9_9BACT|nr:hypothetical protein [Desulfonatronospira thiodismutans]EFI32755.1 hypothetical protein Dthio_PD0044 [Desulfonatronospira thiodismutans ASO3-1]
MSTEVSQLNPLLIISENPEAKELDQRLNCMVTEAIPEGMDERAKANRFIVWIEQKDTGEHDALIYYGTDEEKNLTAKKEYAETLQNALKLNADIVQEEEPNLLAQWHRDNRPQTKSKHAIKLETKEFDLDILTTALSDTFGIQEQEEDQQLVKEAYEEVYNIMNSHFSKAVEDVGQYLIEKFYNNNIDRARKNKPVKQKSLRALIQSLEHNNYSQAWFYNAVKIALDKKELEGTHYNQLSVSHRRALTKVKNTQQKAKLAEEVVNNDLSVRALEEKVKKQKTEKEGFSLKKLPNKNKLKLKRLDELESIKTKIEHRINSLETKIEKFREEKKNYNNNLKKVEALISEKSSS